MIDLRTRLQRPSMKYVVLGLVAVNCLGLYAAQLRLSQPYAGAGADEVELADDLAEAATARSRELLASSDSLLFAPRPMPAALASRDALAAPAPLPLLKTEPAVALARTETRPSRLGFSGPRAAPRQRASYAERRFEAAFTPDYAALAPYDGSAEAADEQGLVAREDQTAPLAEAVPAPSARAINEDMVEAPMADAPVAELPAVMPDAAQETPTG